MYLQVTDGQAKLAIHKINVTLDSQNESLKNRLSPYQQEDFGLVAYSVAEKDAILGILSSFTLTSTIEDLSYTADVLSKVQSKKYNTRTEALDDIEGRTKPTEIDQLKSAQADILFAMVTNNLM